MTKNREVAEVLKEISILLDIKGEKFKPRAYMRAVRTVSSMGEDIETIAKRDELTQMPGIGLAIAEKIKNFLETGTIDLLEDLRKNIPVKVMELEAIPGVGPKTIKLVYEQLGVTDLDSLEKAAKAGKLAGLKGLGTKTQEQIIDGIRLVRAGMQRTLLVDAMEIAEKIEKEIKAISEVKRVIIAGSFRRRKETIGDLDFLVDATDSQKVMEAFVSIEDVGEVLAQGDTKSSIRLKNRLQVDLRVLPPESFGAGMQYFTGNVDHNVRLRSIAIKKGLRLNEYGLFKGDEKIAGKDEKEIYKILGLQFVPPELREDRGEVEAAQLEELPNLVELKDIRGDLHNHTDQSDGTNTIEEMVDAAEAKEYEYFCISDHTQSLTIANGMDEERLLNRIEEIDELNSSGRWKLKILKGAEVDILADGGLDIDDSVLAQLDVVTVSIHSRMKDSKQVMTERVCAALENKYVHILGHPTGRLILRRPEFEIDLEQVFDVAKRNNVAMELNAHPHRLDLNDGNLRAATKMGLKIAINTDAHKIPEIDYIKFGIFQARRGWLTKEDVVNTYPLKTLNKVLRK